LRKKQAIFALFSQFLEKILFIAQFLCYNDDYKKEICKKGSDKDVRFEDRRRRQITNEKAPPLRLL
jgi:hypothetical protein